MKRMTSMALAAQTSTPSVNPSSPLVVVEVVVMVDKEVAPIVVVVVMEDAISTTTTIRNFLHFFLLR